MRKIVLGAAVIFLAVLMSGCEGGVQLMDTTWTYEHAVISLPDGKTIEGKVESWLDFENSDQLQVKINGKTYLTHATNVVLISE